MSDRKIQGFKKFSDMKKSSKIEEVDFSSSVLPMSDSDMPMNPNLPKDSKKIEKPASRKNLIPVDQDINLSDDINERVNFTGKVAKFPKNTKASKAYNFLENVKISKDSIWYIMVEKFDGLQMVKYNYKKGVDINRFLSDLKDYYISKNKDNRSVCEAISKMTIDGNDKYSMIKNIPLVELDGKKMVTKITEDLIKLLSK
jgi:hypothetical protein